MRLKHSSVRLVVVLCFALVTAACGDDDSGPTAPTLMPVTLTGPWAGTFGGNLVSGNGQMMLTQEGTNVTGAWSAPMPELLLANGAPPGVDLAGPITGTVAGTTATLALRVLEVFVLLLGGATECGLDVNITSFNETSMEGSYTTNDSCPPPINDQGTLTFMRQ